MTDDADETHDKVSEDGQGEEHPQGPTIYTTLREYHISLSKDLTIQTASSNINKKNLGPTPEIKTRPTFVMVKTSPRSPQLRRIILMMTIMRRSMEAFLQTWMWPNWRALADLVFRWNIPGTRICTNTVSQGLIRPLYSQQLKIFTATRIL